MTATEKRRCIECQRKFEPPQRKPGAPIAICSEACRRTRRNRQQNNWRRGHDCPDHLHGSISGYGTYGCRCEQCCAANTKYSQAKRAKAKALG